MADKLSAEKLGHARLAAGWGTVAYTGAGRVGNPEDVTVADLVSEIDRLKAKVERQGRLLVDEGEKLLAAESDVRALERKLAGREREVERASQLLLATEDAMNGREIDPTCVDFPLVVAANQAREVRLHWITEAESARKTLAERDVELAEAQQWLDSEPDWKRKYMEVLASQSTLLAEMVGALEPLAFCQLFGGPTPSHLGEDCCNGCRARAALARAREVMAA